MTRIRSDGPAASSQAVSNDASTEQQATHNEGEPPQRVIDENTDLSTLTDQEIMRLMENSSHTAEDVSSKVSLARISAVPLLVIRKEYENGSPQVVKKLDWLQEHGWAQVWRARGDGDCFYRSFTLAYLLRILHSPDPALTANLAFDALQRAVPSMQQVGFDPDLYEEFLNPLLELIRAFDPNTPGATPSEISEYSLLNSLQDAERSNCIVVALRLLTAAYIRLNGDTFAPFLLSPVTFEPLSPEEFCRQEVEPCGKEADHAQIMALAETLGVGVRVAYLDRSEVGGGTGDDGGVINWVEFSKSSDEAPDPLTLLYRPGHYDVLTKDAMLAKLSA